MAEVTLYRLRPRGPMCFGVRSFQLGSADVITKDVVPLPTAATFFSAWCWAIRDLSGPEGLTDWITAFRSGSPPCLLASPAPWIGDVLLLPRPSLPARRAPETSEPVQRDKRGKRYRWVAESLWWKLVRGEDIATEFDRDAAFVQGQTIWAGEEAGAALAARLTTLGERVAVDVAEGAEPAFWRTVAMPHVTVDRRTQAGNIYERSATWFAPGVDIALPVIWRDEAHRARAEQALVLLGETGIGGERSAGYGQFDVAPRDDGDTERRTWPDVDAAATFVTLAPYHPRPDEVTGGVFASPASYDFVVSEGWIERTTLRQAVRLVTAGSVLCRLPGQSVYGSLVDVTPAAMSHPVYRYGYAFPLPCAGD